MQRSAGNRAVGRLLAGSPPRRSLARAPWYRGQIDPGEYARLPARHIHDFGDGVYIAETAELGGAYAALRSAREKDLSRAELLMGDIPDEAFFRTLDLRADPRWAAFLNSPWSGDPALGSWRNLLPPNGPNENYERVFLAFLRQYDIRLEDYDSVIGEEMVRGGTQVCLRTPRAQQEVLGRMTVVGRGTQIPQVAAEAARAAAAAGGGGGGSGRAGTAGGVGRRNPVVRVTIPRTTPVEEPPSRAADGGALAAAGHRHAAAAGEVAGEAGAGRLCRRFGASMLLGIAAALLRSSLDQRIIDHQLADLAPELDAAVRARIPDALEVRADDPELPVYLRTCVRVARTSTDGSDGRRDLRGRPADRDAPLGEHWARPLELHAQRLGAASRLPHRMDRVHHLRAARGPDRRPARRPGRAGAATAAACSARTRPSSRGTAAGSPPPRS